MTIKLRILTLLSLVGALFVGIFVIFQHSQAEEERTMASVRQNELRLRLQSLVNSASRSSYRYLRNYSARVGMVEFLEHPDPAWADRQIRGRMDLYRLDRVWVLRADGSLAYGLNWPTGSVLTAPPLPAAELAPLFARNLHFSFFLQLDEGLFQLQGMPIKPPADLDRTSAARGWLIVAKRWGQPMLEDLADAGHGRIILTPAVHASDVRSAEELEAWTPLLNHRGEAIAGIDYHVMDALDDDAAHEQLEMVLLLVNNLAAILLVGAMLHYWILRPFLRVRASLVARDPAPLAPLLGQNNEFGQMARIVESSLRDRAQLQQSHEQRLQLARELHDGAIQGIYGAGLSLGSAQALVAKDPAAAQQLLQATRVQLNAIITEIRNHINRIDPTPAGPSFGETVAQLIQQLHGPGPVATEIDIEEELVARLAPLQRSQLLQFVREAVSNALRHGRAYRIGVSWRTVPDGSRLVVADDGVGFDPKAVSGAGRGLGNLSERALLLGAKLALESSAPGGTRVSLHFPPPK